MFFFFLNHLKDDTERRLLGATDATKRRATGKPHAGDREQRFYQRAPPAVPQSQSQSADEPRAHGPRELALARGARSERQSYYEGVERESRDDGVAR